MTTSAGDKFISLDNCSKDFPLICSSRLDKNNLAGSAVLDSMLLLIPFIIESLNSLCLKRILMAETPPSNAHAGTNAECNPVLEAT